MPTKIINKGSSLQIVIDDAPRFILKNQIKEVEVVRDSIIKIDIGQGALYNIFVDQAEVVDPVTETVEQLRDKIMEMLESSVGGLATEQLQKEGNVELVSMKTTLDTLSIKVASMNDKTFYEPTLVDESNSNVVYKGFALGKAKGDEPVWAIQKITNSKGVLSYLWASGDKNFNKVWDNRKVLSYE